MKKKEQASTDTIHAVAKKKSNKYEEMFDYSPTSSFLLDDQGRIEEINLAGAALLELDRIAAIKKRFVNFVTREDRPVIAELIKRLILTNAKQTCEIKLLTGKDAIDVHVEGIAPRDIRGKRKICHVTVIDITDRKRADILKKLMVVSQAVLAETSVDGLLQRIVDVASELIGANVIVAGHSYMDGSITVGATSSAAAEMLEAPERRIPLGQGLIYVELILKAGVVRLTDQELCLRHLKWSMPPGHPPLRGLLGVKLTGTDGQSEGLIVLSDKTNGGDFTTDDETLLVQLAAIASLGLRNVKIRRKLVDRADELTAANQALDAESSARIRTQETLDRLASFPKLNPNPIIEADVDGRIHFLNPTAERLFPDFQQSGHDHPWLAEWETVVRSFREDGKRIHAREVFVGEKCYHLVMHYVEEIQRIRIYGLDITDRHKKEQKLYQLNRTLKALSNSSQTMVRVTEESEYLQEVCRIVVNDCGHAMVWIGFAEQDEAKSVQPIAHAGFEEGYLETLKISWADTERGRGPTGTTIRTGQVTICRNMLTDPNFLPWRAEAIKRGYSSSIACPLTIDSKTFGAITIYSPNPDPFSEDEVRLLTELANDLSFGIRAIRLRKAHAQAEEELRQAKEAAEAANKAKSQLFTNISHDLRTPMNAILGMIELALDETINPTVEDYLKTTKESAILLLELLNEILDLSRMEAGKFHLDCVPFNMRSILDHTLKILKMRADEKGLELICDFPADVPDQLIGDPLRISQVLMNLVGNAIKFTAEGKVLVRVQAESRSDEDVCLQFIVEDTGTGISTQDQEKIFAPFTQADDSISHNYGGTGLGLTIATNLIEMMGGRIWVESQVGQGSKFYFTVRFRLQLGPANPSESTTAVPSAIGKPTAVIVPLRILLAEDNPANQKVAMYILTKHGHSVEVVSNGLEAVERVQREDFDLVLMDVQMSKMDGFQATAAIRALQDPAKARLPIAAMTAYAMKEDQERCFSAGMDGYIAKPINAQDLIELVERLGSKIYGQTSDQVSVPAKEERTSEMSQSANPENMFNLDEAVRRCFGKYELFQEMAAYLFEEADPLLEQMRTALGNGDAAELGRVAHRLKGTISFLGAPIATEANRRVERMGLAGDLNNAAEAIEQLDEQVRILMAAVGSHRKSNVT